MREASLLSLFLYSSDDNRRRLHYTKQKPVELVPVEKVLWLVTEANPSFVDKADE